MKKEDIYNYLKFKEIWHEIIEHKAVYNMEEAATLDIPYPEAEAKNIFVRDDKKRNYYLITVKGNKKLNLKKIEKMYNTRRLSFASEGDLMKLMELTPGSVTPFGLLNDIELKVQFFLDSDFMACNHIIGVHPNENTASVWLKVEDLINIIKEHGNKIQIVELT